LEPFWFESAEPEVLAGIAAASTTMATIASISQSTPGPGVWGRTLLIIGRLFLGAIFLLAAFESIHFDGKWHLHDYYFYSAMALYSYSLRPVWAILLLSRILPWLELTLGVLLVAGAGLRWTGSCATALMIAFNYASIVSQLRNTQGFSDVRGNLSPSILIRDGSLLLLALSVTIGAFLIKRRRAAVSS
jgi:uncharacterized membrane protein YphA (DoxX/SURF4 family)